MNVASSDGRIVFSPERCGSSENDSKARPANGERWILHVGASRITDDFTLASSAKKLPTEWIRSTSNVDASDVAHLMYC
jgi:hypothetical protein